LADSVNGSAGDPGRNLPNPSTAPGVNPGDVVRVLFLGTTFALGGAERVLSHLVRGLNHPPFQVEVLALRHRGTIGDELSASGIPISSELTGPGRVDPTLVPRLRARLRRGRYDAIYFLDHAHAVFYGTVASWGTSVRVRVMPVHTTGQWNGRPSLRRPIRLVRSHLTRIIAIAETQRRYLIEEEGVPSGQLVVIPNGVPLERPDASVRERSRSEVRRQWDESEETPLLGITAVLRPEKNHELLLAAFRRVRLVLPQARLWIIGDGPQRAFLEAEVTRLGLSIPAVRFLGQRGDSRRLMSGLDVATLASHPRVETLPLSLIEAMDAGIPVVSTRVGALPELVEDGRSGLLVDSGDEEGLAAALLRLLQDPPLRKEMGLRGQAIVQERYSVEGMVEATAALLLDLLRRAR
jgi:glycosyltransferase involved in cell wall biosynthesis